MKFKYLFVLAIGLGTTLTQVGAQTYDRFAESYNAIDDYVDSEDEVEDDYIDDDINDYEEDAELIGDVKAQTLRKIYMNDFAYRWYIQAGGGAQLLMAEDDHKGKLQNRVTLAPSLTLGYRFNKIWGLRMNVTGGSLHGFNDGASGSYRFWKKASVGDKVTMVQNIIDAQDAPLKLDGNIISGQLVSNDNIDEIISQNYLNTWDPFWTYKFGESYTNGEVDNRFKFGAGGIQFDQLPNGDKGYSWGPGSQGDLYMQHIRYFAVNFAFTLNLTNLINKSDDNNKFDLSLFFGPTVAHAMKHQYLLGYTGFGFNGGLQAQVHLSEKIGVFTEFSGMALPQGFDGQYGGSKPFDFVSQATLGLTYKIPIAPFTLASEIAEPVPDLGLDELRRSLESEIDAIKPLDSEIDELRKMLEALKAKPVEIVKESIFFQKPVHFVINRWDIRPSEMQVVAEVAEYLRANPDASVIVTGYADKGTGNATINERLSRERSKNVADTLVNQFGIDKDRVAIDWRGDVVQPFYENDLNRAVLFYIEFE